MHVEGLYRDIVTRLQAGDLSDATFEKIAVRLATSFGLRVLPTPGGQDAGYDGAILDTEGGRLPGVLVATMQRNGLANLRRNLTRHLETYPEAAKTAFFVTTRRKTNPQKEALFKEAERMGYALRGIADEPAVAEFLYYSPDSCYELLGFRGVPSALSSLPPRRRPHWNVELVGRDVAVERLGLLKGDATLAGIPGSGKTSLLSQAAAENRGLFARAADRDRLAPDLREHRPKAVFIDGLDDQFAAVQTLVSLREESGIGFDIVVTGWYEDERIVELLSLGPGQRIRLDPLGLDELVEVVRRVGVVGPRELVHNIVRQAGGSPGLAVTLAMACLGGNVGEVVTGAILLRQVRTALRSIPLVGREAERALAAIAVGGDAGMAIDEVAEAISMDPLALRRLLSDIEAGGVIRPRGRGDVSVQPAHLRAVLVATNFYDRYATSVNRLLDRAPNRGAALLTLIEAAQNTPEPPELRSLLIVDDETVFVAYASLGAEQCRWVLGEHPEYLVGLSRVALHYIPEEVLFLLIAAAKGDERQLHSTPEQPIRIIQDWCQRAQPGDGAVVKRREMAIDAALRYMQETGDIDTAAGAFAGALTTEYQSSYADPGQGLTLTMEWGVLTPEEIEMVARLWGRCRDRLQGHGKLPWKTLLNIARNVAAVRPVSDESRVARSRAAGSALRRTMARDIFELGGGHPGVAYEARQLAGQTAGWPVESEPERLYALLFGERFGGNYGQREAELAVQLTMVAEEWSRRSPDEAMEMLAGLTLAQADVREWGTDRRYFLARQLSERVDVLPWLQTAIRHKLDYSAVSPFLRKAMSAEVRGWVDAARSCIGAPSEPGAVECVLLAGGPAELLAVVGPLLPKHIGIVRQICMRNEVSPEAAVTLLAHDDDRVAAGAAVSLWHGRDGRIEEAMKDAWRRAFLRSNYEDSLTGEILASESSIAFQWLMRRIREADWRTLMQDYNVRKAIKPLNEDQRVALLVSLSEPTALHHLIGPLMGGSVQVFKRVLAAGGRERVCLNALERARDEVWAGFIVAAHEKGISVSDLAQASSFVSEWQGPESAALQRESDEIAVFLEDSRSPVSEVAHQMTELLAARRDRALASEREERVWGR